MQASDSGGARRFAIIDGLIHPRLLASGPDELQRVRVLAGATLLVVVDLLVNGSIAIFVYGPQPTTMGALGALAVCFAIVGLRLRVFGLTRGAGFLICVSSLAAMAFVAMHQGSTGILLSPSLAVVVLLAQYLEDMKAALAVTVLAIAAIIAVYFAHVTGHPLPASAPAADPFFIDTVVASFAVCCVVVLLGLMAKTRARAYEALQRALVAAENSEAARKKAEHELRLAQKLESVGRLAAGVAHEINTPIQYVSDSVKFAREGMDDLKQLVTTYQQLHRDGPLPAHVVAALGEAEEAADLAYLMDEVPPALTRALEGLDRVARIVRSMKEFAHPDVTKVSDIDLNHTVHNTLTVAASEYKLVAEVKLELGQVGPVRCVGGEIGQAILNIVVNAAHAISERHVREGKVGRGTISIKSWSEPRVAVLSVADTGSGIPTDVQPHIFDPFFTTKEVGRGTGQGLAIAWSVIVEHHKGSLTFETTPGIGTTFFIRLPLSAVTNNLTAPVAANVA